MNAPSAPQHTAATPVGKTVANQTYAHVDCLDLLPPQRRDAIGRAESLAGVLRGRDFNVVKLHVASQAVSLLDYPAFFDTPFPELHRSWHVDFRLSRVGRRSYLDSLNPPILHRKELLLPPDHPRRSEYVALTAEAESAGLFSDPCRIGFRDTWEQLIRERGYKVVGHQLIPLANEELESLSDSPPDDSGGVARHLTALARYGFSAPLQALARYGLVTPGISVFDYGCGRGDDVRGLLENGITAAGWDPHFAPDQPKQEAEVVNLGFVINVIEDFAERVEALRGAYSLTRGVLAVSAMLASQAVPNGKPYRDGFLTSRNTFQKYYTQGQLAAFIAHVLEEEPLPVSPGVFFIFRDKDLEQRFLSGRQRSSTLLQRLSRPERVRVRVRVPRPDRDQIKYEANREALETLWATWLRLGREPEKDEAPDLDKLVGSFGSLSRAEKFIAGLKDEALLKRARTARTADLTVYFALGQFSKRKPYKHLEPGLQRDVKALFGDYASAQAHARQALFSLADTSHLATACSEAAEQGLGWLEEGKSLQLHTNLIERLPAALRVYIGCGTVLYGDVQAADLVKIHIGSGKLTLMKFDDFAGKPLPRMVERIKLNLRSQDIDVFSYGEEFEPPYLYLKSRYINEEFPGYAEQVAFDEALTDLNLFDLSGFGPKPGEFDRTLAQHRWEVDGARLNRTRSIPDLDSPCGRYHTYRQLIECGDTWKRTKIKNRPKEPETYTALYDLAVHVLDPVVEYYGSITLTYGFCSSELARLIPRGIAPKLDQHAAHERNRLGNYVCDRLGAAVDFVVADESMREVANWIADNLQFDRLYYYGDQQPIHVSFSAHPKGEVVDIVRSASGQVPRMRNHRRLN